MLVELVVEVDVTDVKQLQALKTRELPQVATTVGVARVLFKKNSALGRAWFDVY